jgi:chlorophyllide a reductase subunit Y
MCPAFGSLARWAADEAHRQCAFRLGLLCLRPDLHFALLWCARSVGYVPFNSETLVTGKLFEDIRDAVFELAKPEDYDAIVVTNLCVPSASGVPLRLLPKEINGVRIIGIDVPGLAFRPMPRPRTCWPARCLSMPARKR